MMDWMEFSSMKISFNFFGSERKGVGILKKGKGWKGQNRSREEIKVGKGETKRIILLSRLIGEYVTIWRYACVEKRMF